MSPMKRPASSKPTVAKKKSISSLVKKRPSVASKQAASNTKSVSSLAKKRPSAASKRTPVKINRKTETSHENRSPDLADGQDQILAMTYSASLEKSSAFRSINVQKLGGESFQVSIASNCNVGDLHASVCGKNSLGFCITLISSDGKELRDVSAPLPEGDQVQCVIESLSALCAPAQRVLAQPYTATREGHDMLHLRLGLCRALGSFDGIKWKEPILNANVIEEGDESDDDMFEEIYYNVFEFTLIDGSDKRIQLIGVISDGPRDSRIAGMFGSIYLRPNFQEIGKLHNKGSDGLGSGSSEWRFEDQSWYEDHATPLPSCESERCGGGERAKTPLQMHLAHALSIATESGLNDVDHFGGDQSEDYCDQSEDL